MKDKELKKIYNKYFQETLKATKEYEKLFNYSTDMQQSFVSKLSKEDREEFENIIESFIVAEDQMLEDTFVNAVKHAYKVFKEIAF